jgi:antitoxin (DNA-binding transcriptional repressor) of toxin-antitoxin stability system
MTKSVTIEEAQKDLAKLVDEIRGGDDCVILCNANGPAVKIVPLGGPSGVWKGRPYYTMDDCKHRDTPYPNEPKWE